MSQLLTLPLSLSRIGNLPVKNCIPNYNFQQLVPRASLIHHRPRTHGGTLTHISNINTALLPPRTLFFSLHLSAWVLRIAVKTLSELVFLLVENYYLTTPAALRVAGNIWNPFSRKRILFTADCPCGWP
jgi:hypothetical protein